ncbi:MAG TPA: LegC family aminotransferase [Pyrinomonadaceae bacterium]|nr:LegC family aminotransferase [Pyrinomonadaceae bacterium]
MTSAPVTVPLCAPEIRGNEWKYVKECLDTGWVSTVGSFVERFEYLLAQSVGAKWAVATNSGTSALHIALLVAGVQPNDEVLVSTLSFIAPANAIRYVGAWPVFVDAESAYWQMDPQKLEEFLRLKCQWRNGGLYDRVTGSRVRAILPVHVLGHPVDMDPILQLAQKYELTVIEDATESLGAKYKGTDVGHIGSIACFSFNGNKLITTGGGGMIVTDNEDWARKAKYLTTQAKNDPVEYVHQEIGYNYRLTNIQAALGVAQLEQLHSYVEAKRRIAAAYAGALRDLPGLTSMREAQWAQSVFWMYTILVDEDRSEMSARQLMVELAARGIQTRPLWQPLHLSRAHQGSCATDCSTAEWVNRRALSLPCSVGLTVAEQGHVIKQLKAMHAPYRVAF